MGKRIEKEIERLSNIRGSNAEGVQMLYENIKDMVVDFQAETDVEKELISLYLMKIILELGKDEI